MPKIKAAKKALRQSIKRRETNTAIRRRVKETFKEIEKLAKTGKKDDAKRMLASAYQLIDKAAKTHVLHKNKAANKKSQLAKMVA